MLSSIHTDVSISFAQEEYMVDEDDGYVMVCLVLDGVVNSTQSQIWVNVSSVDGDTAVGRYMKLCNLSAIN